MNLPELNKRAAIFREPIYSSTLHRTSIRKADDVDDAIHATHVLDAKFSASNVKCVDFDALKLALYPPKPSQMTPCSVDALSFEHNGTFLIEFKFKTAAIENITRKAYDSVMLLIEHGGYTFDQSRKELTYIVVSTGITNRMGDKCRSLWRGHMYCRDPWKKFRNSDDHWKISSLEGVIVKDAYAMHPSTFDYYVRLNKWR